MGGGKKTWNNEPFLDLCLSTRPQIYVYFSFTYISLLKGNEHKILWGTNLADKSMEIPLGQGSRLGRKYTDCTLN